MEISERKKEKRKNKELFKIEQWERKERKRERVEKKGRCICLFPPPPKYRHNISQFITAPMAVI